MATITIDPNYGYAILAATATFWLGAIHTANTGKHRQLAKVAYPAAYAPPERTDHEALCFNGAQRAHANFIENQAQTVPAILIAGLHYPRAAGIMGAVWCLSRFAYMVGYSKGLPGGKGRYQKGGPAFWFAQLGLILTSTWVGVKFITGW